MHMDDLDMQILGKMLGGCRVSNRQIGESLDVASATVKARVRKMLRLGIITEFMLKIDPQALGYDIFYIAVTGKDPDKTGRRLAELGELFVVAPCVGGMTVYGIAVRGENFGSALNGHSTSLSTARSGSSRVYYAVRIAEMMSDDARILSIQEGRNMMMEFSPTKTDMRIIKELMEDPRMSISNISKKTELSTKTITRCIEKLQSHRGFEFTLMYDPTKIQGYVPYAVLIGANGDTSRIAERLERKFAKHFLQIPLMMNNQIALFLYSKDIYGADSIVQEVKEMSGVTATDLFIPKGVKMPQEWIRSAITEAEESPTLHLLY